MPCRCRRQHPPSAARRSGSSRSTARPGPCGAAWRRWRAICRGHRPHRLQRDGGRGAQRELPRRHRRGCRGVDSRSGAVALAGQLARCVPDVVLDSALCGDELVARTARLGERVRPRRPAHRSVARRDRARQRARGALDGLDGVDVMGAAPMRGGSGTGCRPASRCRSGSWATSRGSRACDCATAGTSAWCRHPRWRRVQRWATRSTSSPAGTSSCGRCRARPPACAAPTENAQTF